MSNKKYDESVVVSQLMKKHDIMIPRGEKRVFILYGNSATNDVGIKSKGKLDFLKKILLLRYFLCKQVFNSGCFI